MIKILTYISHILLFILSFLSEGDQHSEKLINTVDLSDYSVYTDTGWEPIDSVHQTKPFKVHHAIFENDNGDQKEIKAADHHLLFYSPDLYKRLDKFKIGESVLTEDGYYHLKSIETIDQYVNMFDLSVNSNKHSYYTNGILSHNTISAGIFLAHFVTFNPDKNVLIIANKGKTVKEIISKTKEIIQGLPFFLQPGVITNNQYSMAFDNGSRLIGETASKNPAIGFTIHAVYADEFAHIAPGIVDSYYRSVYPTISASGGKFIVTSTPNGYNKFFEIYNNAINGNNEYVATRIDWWQVPDRDDEWAENEINNLGSLESFEQEYGNAFLSSGVRLLNPADFRRLKKIERDYKKHTFDELDEWGIDQEECFYFDSKFNIEKLYDREHFFVIGADAAEGIGNGGDDTVFNIFQLIPMTSRDLRRLHKPPSLDTLFAIKQVGYFESNRHSTDKAAEVLYLLTHEIISQDNCKISIEYNNYGSEIIDKMSTVFPQINDFGLEIIIKYKHRNDAQNYQPGVKMRSGVKASYAIKNRNQQREGRMFITSEKTRQQYEHYGKKGKSYEAMQGNDDHVAACLCATAAFGTTEWVELCEIYFDFLPEEKQEEIDSVLDYTDFEDEHEDMSDLFDEIANVAINNKGNKKSDSFSKLLS